MFHYGKCPKCGKNRIDVNEDDSIIICRSCGHEEKVEDYAERLRAKMPKVSWTPYHCPICGKITQYEKYIPTLSEAYDEKVKLELLVQPCDDCKNAIKWAKQRMQEGTQNKFKTMYKGYEVVDGNKIIIPITEYDRLLEEIK